MFRSLFTRRGGAAVAAATIGMAGMSLAFAGPAGATPNASLLIGSGSQTSYATMTALSDLFNGVPGCDLTAATALPATLAWRYPTVDALAPFLAECMGITLDAAGAGSTSPAVPIAAPATTKPTEPTEPTEPALDLEALSDSDVEALLLERLDVIAPAGHDVADERA